MVVPTTNKPTKPLSAEEKQVRLANLSTVAHSNIIERVMLADDLLRDGDWLATQFAGDEEKARDALQDLYFGDLCQLMTLGQLIEVLHTFPDEGEWKKRRYSLKRLWADYKESKKTDKEPTERKTATVKDVEERDQKILELEYRLKKAQEQNEMIHADYSRARSEVEELRAELKVTKKELQRLRTMMMSGVGSEVA
jgi:peptidoglycan hydrolase CwlO-like protein